MALAKGTDDDGLIADKGNTTNTTINTTTIITPTSSTTTNYLQQRWIRRNRTFLRVCERVLTTELYSSSASCCMNPPRGPCCANWGNSCRNTCAPNQ